MLSTQVGLIEQKQIRYEEVARNQQEEHEHDVGDRRIEIGTELAPENVGDVVHGFLSGL